METNDPNLNQARVDEAVSARLAQLGNMPIDTTRLLKRVEAEIPRPQTQMRQRENRMWLGWISPVRALAAGILLLIAITALILTMNPSTATAAELAGVHRSMLATGGTMVNSMEAANAALSRDWPDAPSLPQTSEGPIMACCVQKIGRQKLACAMSKIDDTPITICTADVDKFRAPSGKTVVRNGISYQIDSADGINMVISQQHGQWICVMGALALDRLEDFASSLHW